ncbi:hypothetical protein [Mycobacterium persicum]|uniref:Uncharacterized protein n=1 Tax=Mycobacterium persicum TaxID=1487726 RepID=A0AB38UWF6_9MYCO|nr:hypothetical protein [Mycobacterium persicum]VAZ78224.1 hypothetical protein LAUMK15_04249 [Mycobacterium persicum]VAZ84905.1 hypothetical protein LAUMK42_03733 [Mycobacterium persicum]VAZ91844.1 hypothetical protein LAUMK4_01913 [Mycobacterium persicum]
MDDEGFDGEQIGFDQGAGVLGAEGVLSLDVGLLLGGDDGEHIVVDG